jgi:hypothetical protein
MEEIIFSIISCLRGILNTEWPEIISDQKLWNIMRQEEITMETESEKVLQNETHWIGILRREGAEED